MRILVVEDEPAAAAVLAKGLREHSAEQEVELTVRGLTAGMDIALVIDGHTVATAKADRRGGVEIALAAKTTP